ncbi:hypothetical protein [Chamaesiphon minutus]|uniref:Uncharacterized protein n=1 Tax=Chamaesiphon minutus (strain ATCC 27169 / PCC 6605) TaxID=1173020 RepID=K9UP63_CHAP6|nr:hypothetical protein [Chamaesiphon minutus]AFY95984.1 hypothetical protein Cha6605_5083 [Chamaesiphon minutus PCC 6605]
MKSRKHSKLKRHPLVRFIRGILRLMRVVFRPKRRNQQAIHNERQQRLATELVQQQELAQQLELEHRERERSITVGALLDRVKWQVPELTIVQEQVSDRRAVTRPHDVSRN